MRADFHLHSSASDGKLSPEEVVKEAAARGLELITLTDHDTVSGLPPAFAAARRFPLRLIPGVELGTDIPFPEVHLLGYFVDYADSTFLRELAVQRQSRVERAQQMLEKLQALGLPLSFKRVMELSRGESVGRPHIARAMVEKGYVSAMRDAFARYIGKGCPAYVERKKLTPEQAVRVINAARGLAVLAHPAQMESLDTLLPILKEAGLVGMEAYYNGYPPDTVNRLLDIAHKYDLLPLGGSDYHGMGANDTPIGGVELPPQVVENFLALARKREVYTPFTA